ncbi:MAG: hypothetical protein E6H89_04720 [Chloroflexi bacterium]|nr:MAG: hypothetical protein E6I49_15795 [Chloroflexota bacterium]TMG53560.1 MAG: hypothetical protein E6H89_04720 [Chloroflexota bacterium]
MRFLMYEVDNRASANTPPSPALMAEMGKLVEETTKAGILLATGGLGPNPTRVRSSGGKVAITDGPFTEAKELTGGFALVEVKTKEEAIEWAKRFRKIVGDGESVIQEVFGG